MQISESELKLLVEENCNYMGIVLKRVILFGSRARGGHNKFSDYDILVIVKDTLDIKDKMDLSKKIREALAVKLIGADVLIKSLKEVDYYKNRVGSIVKAAMTEGVVL
ncbi:MAG: nucleotidyltransferase domain-containing protein [Candidatus Omnitrophica bacterium]|nr:nucleotidyltransferase domain-containing protein [Candidatus Omnitrophota bacterium]